MRALAVSPSDSAPMACPVHVQSSGLRAWVAPTACPGCVQGSGVELGRHQELALCACSHRLKVQGLRGTPGVICTCMICGLGLRCHQGAAGPCMIWGLGLRCHQGAAGPCSAGPAGCDRPAPAGHAAADGSRTGQACLGAVHVPFGVQLGERATLCVEDRPHIWLGQHVGAAVHSAESGKGLHAPTRLRPCVGAAQRPAAGGGCGSGMAG